jgi:HEPN domain-containing protein
LQTPLEKYLKVVLAAAGLVIPRIHDVFALNERLSKEVRQRPGVRGRELRPFPA